MIQNLRNHGLRTPNKAFFHRTPKLLGLGRQYGQINFGVFGAFLDNLSGPLLVLWVPCPCFPLINHTFYQKLSLYVRIPNIYLSFEFESQRIRDLAIVWHSPWQKPCAEQVIRRYINNILLNIDLYYN